MFKEFIEIPKKDGKTEVKEKVRKALAREEEEKARKSLEKHLEENVTAKELEKAGKAGREREETENIQS